MKSREGETMKVTSETNRRYEVREMHLFDTDAREEKTMWGVETFADDRRSVNGYLEDLALARTPALSPICAPFCVSESVVARSSQSVNR